MSETDPVQPATVVNSPMVRNERTKLLAGALNTLATTTIASALILPGIAEAYHLTHPLGS
ncbi:hypothetical protein HN018_26595 (plasmid) [Lichenicola cladoniae]|uniref:Uncharacterized protein n=1 Tax=Lichenicola cladoniae TaxID=1484109 RepID=A0A6M8HYR0_9PROT|nr:hypothetical protein [Lichenicola cladoniae]NPD70377.1 hypothetical protein [Acetobacteraceae bacterium]QKE93704.1 hypothetical protein HN018_26595 [Lichenicola cladoniae]